ncbi:MAG TPA: divalent metal cation transporter, partial [Chroococcales cyanobacterium]
IPILTGSSAYALSEAFGWKYGLDRRPHQAKQFYAVIAVATAVGLAMNASGINPMQALFWSAVLNGLAAPPLMVLIMLIASNEKIMGEHVNGAWMKALVALATLAMSAAAIGLFVTWHR